MPFDDPETISESDYDEYDKYEERKFDEDGELIEISKANFSYTLDDLGMSWRDFL